MFLSIYIEDIYLKLNTDVSGACYKSATLRYDLIAINFITR